MICQHRFLDHADGAPCTLEEHPATPNGHSYKTRLGSDVPDGHTASEDAAERSRG